MFGKKYKFSQLSQILDALNKNFQGNYCLQTSLNVTVKDKKAIDGYPTVDYTPIVRKLPRIYKDDIYNNLCHARVLVNSKDMYQPIKHPVTKMCQYGVYQSIPDVLSMDIAHTLYTTRKDIFTLFVDVDDKFTGKYPYHHIVCVIFQRHGSEWCIYTFDSSFNERGSPLYRTIVETIVQNTKGFVSRYNYPPLPHLNIISTAAWVPPNYQGETSSCFLCVLDIYMYIVSNSGDVPLNMLVTNRLMTKTPTGRIDVYNLLSSWVEPADELVDNLFFV
jgi:hypothetical protein